MTIATLETIPANVRSLNAGLYFVQHGTAVICITEHRGVNVVHQYDSRGPEHDMFYDFVTIEWKGEECDFNTVDDARRWIDSELDTDEDDYVRDNRLRMCDVI
jgi:hypothetical protein